MTTTEFTRVYTDGTLDEDWPNSWDPDYWTISDGEDTISTLDLRAKADDWGIYGVAP